MPKNERSAQSTFDRFMTHVVLHHRQGDSALASAAGWIAAAHAIRVGGVTTEWASAADKIAACLEKAYWDGPAEYERQKELKFLKLGLRKKNHNAPRSQASEATRSIDEASVLPAAA